MYGANNYVLPPNSTKEDLEKDPHTVTKEFSDSPTMLAWATKDPSATTPQAHSQLISPETKKQVSFDMEPFIMGGNPDPPPIEQLHISTSYSPHPNSWGGPSMMYSAWKMQTNAMDMAAGPPPSFPQFPFSLPNNALPAPPPPPQAQPQMPTNTLKMGRMVEWGSGFEIALISLAAIDKPLTSKEIQSRYLPEIDTTINSFVNSRSDLSEKPFHEISSQLFVPLNSANVKNVLYLCIHATNSPLGAFASVLRNAIKVRQPSTITVYGINYNSSTVLLSELFVNCMKACYKAMCHRPRINARLRLFIWEGGDDIGSYLNTLLTTRDGRKIVLSAGPVHDETTVPVSKM